MTARAVARREASSDAEMVDAPDRAAMDFVALLDDVQPRLHQLELQAVDLGLAVAPLYLASARGSLRHVLACLLHQRGAGRAGGTGDAEICPGTSLRLAPVNGREGVGERVRSVGRRTSPAPGGDVPSWAARPDLGAALLGSNVAVTLCRGPVGAGLLFDALARHRWLHSASGAKWASDVSGAHALVTALAGGAGFPHPGPFATAGLVDREVADLLAGMGWLRMVSTPMPAART